MNKNTIVKWYWKPDLFAQESHKYNETSYFVQQWWNTSFRKWKTTVTTVFSPCFIFVDSFSTILYRSINILKILKSKLNVLSEWSNTQQLIFNSRKQYWNWEGLLVIEKWVFFKLLLQPYKQTHLGVRITASYT